MTTLYPAGPPFCDPLKAGTRVRQLARQGGLIADVLVGDPAGARRAAPSNLVGSAMTENRDLFAIDGNAAEGMESFPGDSRRIGDPVLVRLRIAAGLLVTYRDQIDRKFTRFDSASALSRRSLYRSTRYGATSRVNRVNFMSSSMTSTTRS